MSRRSAIWMAMLAASCGRIGYDEGPGRFGIIYGDGGEAGGGSSDGASASDLLVADDFERTTSGDWGSAPIGGPWALANPNGEMFTVDGLGNVAIAASDSFSSAQISPTAVDVEARMVIVFSRLPSIGSSYGVAVFARLDSGAYDFDVRLQSNGSSVRGEPATRATAMRWAVDFVVPTSAANSRNVRFVRSAMQVCNTRWRCDRDHGRRDDAQYRVADDRREALRIERCKNT